MGTTTSSENARSAVRIKGAGGRNLEFYRPISAQEVMLHNPKHWVTKLGVFRSHNPMEEVILPETVLMPGQAFLLVPFKTMRNLMERQGLSCTPLDSFMDRPGLAIRDWYLRQQKGSLASNDLCQSFLSARTTSDVVCKPFIAELAQIHRASPEQRDAGKETKTRDGNATQQRNIETTEIQSVKPNPNVLLPSEEGRTIDVAQKHETEKAVEKSVEQDPEPVHEEEPHSVSRDKKAAAADKMIDESSHKTDGSNALAALENVQSTRVEQKDKASAEPDIVSGDAPEQGSKPQQGRSDPLLRMEQKLAIRRHRTLAEFLLKSPIVTSPTSLCGTRAADGDGGSRAAAGSDVGRRARSWRRGEGKLVWDEWKTRRLEVHSQISAAALRLNVAAGGGRRRRFCRLPSLPMVPEE